MRRLSPPDLRLDERDADELDLDQDVVRSERWIRDLAQRQDLGCSELLDYDRSHLYRSDPDTHTIAADWRLTIVRSAIPREMPRVAVMGQAAESVPDRAAWLQTSMVGRGAEHVAGFAADHGITFVDCPVIGTRETAKRGRLVVLASGPGDALDRAQPVFDAIGSTTVRLEPEVGGVSRTKLVVSAWTVGLLESFRCHYAAPRALHDRGGSTCSWR